MILMRKNKLGGRPLTGFPYEEDKGTGYLGRKIGYCSGCNEPILIRSIEVREIASILNSGARPKPRISLRHRVIEYLGGKVGE